MPQETAAKPPQRRPKNLSVAQTFTQAIDEAEQAGVDRGDMTLNLTLSDASELKRDRTIALEDISFKAGEMRFKGVKVNSGGVSASSLDRGEG